MILKKNKTLATSLLLGTLAVAASPFAMADVTQDVSLLPNRAAKTLTVPSGYGAHSNTVFAGIGGTAPQVYSDKDDGVLSFGVGLGNPAKNVGVQLSATLNDASDLGSSAFFGFKLHRKLGNGSIAVGGENLFPQGDGSDADESFYVSYSHAIQGWTFVNTNVSRLNLTVGAGSGRFSKLSPADVVQRDARGKTGHLRDHGTTVFGAATVAFSPRVNGILEWNGKNLNAGVSVAPFSRLPVTFNVGVADLTNFTGDGERIIGSMSVAYKL